MMLKHISSLCLSTAKWHLLFSSFKRVQHNSRGLALLSIRHTLAFKQTIVMSFSFLICILGLDIIFL